MQYKSLRMHYNGPIHNQNYGTNDSMPYYMPDDLQTKWEEQMHKKTKINNHSSTLKITLSINTTLTNSKHQET